MLPPIGMLLERFELAASTAALIGYYQTGFCTDYSLCAAQKDCTEHHTADHYLSLTLHDI